MIRIYPYLFACQLKRIRPIVDVFGVPVFIRCELLIERLHKSTFANAGLGNNERHARAIAECPCFVARGAVVPQTTQPRQFLFTPEKFSHGERIAEGSMRAAWGFNPAAFTCPTCGRSDLEFSWREHARRQPLWICRGFLNRLHNYLKECQHQDGLCPAPSP